MCVCVCVCFQAAGGGMSDLLEAIRKGKELRPVSGGMGVLLTKDYNISLKYRTSTGRAPNKRLQHISQAQN